MADRAELEALRKQKRLRELESRIAKPVTPSQVEAAPQPKGSALSRFGRGMMDQTTLNALKISKVADDLGRGTLNMFGADMGDTPAELPWSKESIRAKQASADDSLAGKAGSVYGDVIMTAPLGAIGRGMQAGQNLPVVGRLLGSRPAQAAVEGAVAGTLAADPENRGEGAREGALTGAALERGGRLLGRTMEGLVKRSPEAQQLDNLADLHGTKVQLPLATAASDEGMISPFAKFLYGRVLPALPGTSGTLGRQSQRAAAQLREIAMREAAPGGMGSSAPGFSGGLPMTTSKQPGAGSNVRLTMKDIQDAFASEYKNTIGSYAFNQPNGQDFMAFLQQKVPNIDNATLTNVAQDFESLASKFSKQGVLDGEQLMRMKAQLASRGREHADDVVGQSYQQAQEFLDEIVKTELSQGNNFQNMVDLQRYLDLAEPWKNFQRVQRAAARSADPEGQFTPGELMRAAKAMSTDAQLARGAAPMQELASIGERTVGTPQGAPSFLERGMAWSALAGLGLVGSPAGAAATWAGGRAAASPAVQDILMGTTDTQRALTQALRKRPLAKRLTGASVRNTMAAEVADDEQEQ